MYLFLREGDELCLYGKVFELVIPGLETVTLSEEEVPAQVRRVYDKVCGIQCTHILHAEYTP